MRIFIGINLSKEIKEDIYEKIKIFKENFRSLRWVKKENLHITLKFIGDFQEEIENLIEILEEIDFAPFKVEISDFDFFPNKKIPRVFYLGVRDEKENILKLYKNIENKLRKIGIKKDKRRFIPHITIARKKNKDRVFINEAIIKENFLRREIFIDNFTLFESILGRDGAVYKKIKVFS